MIGFLKRWFVTKNELNSIQHQLDNLAHGIQQTHLKMLVDADANTEQWRPTQKGSIPNGGAEVKRHTVSNLRASKLPAKQVVVDKPNVIVAFQNKQDELVRNTILVKMIQLAGSQENFVKLCRKKVCTALVSKAARLKMDQCSSITVLREYPHGSIILGNNKMRTKKGYVRSKVYSFKNEHEYKAAKAILQSINCPYTTGRTK